MSNILLSISIKKIAWFVINNWVVFAIFAFVVCAAMIFWLIREVIKSGKDDEDEDSDKSPVTAKTDRDESEVLEEALEPTIVEIPQAAPKVEIIDIPEPTPEVEIIDIPEPTPEVEIIDIPQEDLQQTGSDIFEAPDEAEAPEIPDETPGTKETEPIAEIEQIDITEDISLQQESETNEEFSELDDLDVPDEDIDSQDLEITDQIPVISGSDSLDEILDEEIDATIEEANGTEVAKIPVIISEAKDDKARKKQEKRKVKEAKKQKKDKKSKRRKKSASFDFSSPELITESDYRLITKRILKIKQKTRSILFAAAARKSLPITIPVNIAIQLAEDKHRCLLIDLDLKRNGIAKAFDIDDKPNHKRHRPMHYPTQIKDLFVWPAHNFTRSRHMNIIHLARAAVEKFDYVLIIAPYLIGSPDRVQIATASEFSIIFTQNTTQAEKLDSIIELTECKILANYQVSG